jgi:hypothetical protein
MPVDPAIAELERRATDHRPTEEEVDMRDTVPQRNDRKGTKIEDLAGTGEIDSAGG